MNPPSNNQPAGGGQLSATDLPLAPPAPMIENGVATSPPVAVPTVPYAQGAQASTMPTIPLPLPAAPQSGGQPVINPINPSLGFQVADDKDIIEPEWVNKAKAIVAQSGDDPYRQSEELTIFKADYMQKRYNKTIKLK
jgi:hypothetical protein